MGKYQTGPSHQEWRRSKLLISYVHRCDLQSLLQMGQMAKEELEKVSL